MALTRSLTACATATAWSCPSSQCSVIQTISIGIPCFSTSSFAAASPPCVRHEDGVGRVLCNHHSFQARRAHWHNMITGALGCSAPQPLSRPAISVTMSTVLVLVFMVASPVNHDSRFCGSVPSASVRYCMAPWFSRRSALARVAAGAVSVFSARYIVTRDTKSGDCSQAYLQEKSRRGRTAAAIVPSDLPVARHQGFAALCTRESVADAL